MHRVDTGLQLQNAFSLELPSIVYHVFNFALSDVHIMFPCLQLTIVQPALNA